MATTIYGFENFRFYVSNPYGHSTWFATCAERDAARALLIERAEKAGLSDPTRAFSAVSMVLSPEGEAWLQELQDCGGELRPHDDMSHTWSGPPSDTWCAMIADLMTNHLADIAKPLNRDLITRDRLIAQTRELLGQWAGGARPSTETLTRLCRVHNINTTPDLVPDEPPFAGGGR